MNDEEAVPRREVRRSSAVLIALIATVVLVVIVALVVVFTREGAQSYPADSPEGVVQRYAQAVVDGDIDQALGHLVPEDAEDCDRLETSGADHRITLVRTSDRGDTARVEVIVTEVIGGGPFGPDEYQSDAVFALTRVDGLWKLDVVPWQFVICAESGMP